MKTIDNNKKNIFKRVFNNLYTKVFEYLYLNSFTQILYNAGHYNCILKKKKNIIIV